MKKKIFLSGGGTLGSVMPLLAVWEILKDNYDCVWIGSWRGTEKEYVKKRGLKYLPLPAGKIRKYFNLRNLAAPVFVLAGFLISLFYLVLHRPRAVLVSGSFISVPLVWAAWFFRRKIIVHQEDMEPGLAGKLTFPFASKITTAFPETTRKISGAVCIGNPVRKFFYTVDKIAAKKKWKKSDLPLVLVLGGGLGSEKINKAIPELLEKLKVQLIHITGKGKGTDAKEKNYLQLEKADEELPELMAAADLVISRAGLSTLGELAVLGKPSILAPLAGVGQLENAIYFEKKKAAEIVLEKNLERLAEMAGRILKDEKIKKELEENIKKIFLAHAAGKLAEMV